MKYFPFFSLFFVLCLAGCGFMPIYGNHEGKPAVESSLSKIAIDNIPDGDGQYLRSKLMDRLYFHGRPKKPEATLSVSLKFAETDLGIQKDATAARSQLVLSANYVLRDKNGVKLLSRTAHVVAAYNKISAQYGQLATQRNAYERTMNEAAAQIVNALSLYYAEKAGKEGKRESSNINAAPKQKS